MQVTITANGVLCVTPETGLELYALKKWAEENQDDVKPRMVIELEEK